MATAALQCGTTVHSINTTDGANRTFLLVAPSTACGASSNNQSAVVLCLHGLYQTSTWACEAMCAPYVESLGYVAVCPQGLADSHGDFGWNTHAGSGFDGADDVGSWVLLEKLGESEGA